MTHYVCSECGMVSHQQGVCATDGCMQQGTPLKSCKCEDGAHAEVMNRRGDSLDDPESASPRTVDLDSEESF